MGDTSVVPATVHVPATSGDNGTLDNFLVGWDQKLQVANMLIKSGFLPKAYKMPEHVIATMLTAHELHIPIMMALRTIDIIAGQPTLSPELMLALIYRTGELEDFMIDDDGQSCTVRMKRRNRTVHSESFSMADAEMMFTKEDDKVIKLSQKFNWRSMPKVMRKWRAIAACARVVFPDVLGGMYLNSEWEDRVAENGTGVEEAHDDEPNVKKPAPVLTQGVQLPTFDPRAERITWGKYGPTGNSQGMFWIELPPDYLAWAAEAAKKPDCDKAKATLQFQESIKAQKKDAEASDQDSPQLAFDNPAKEKSIHIRGEFKKAIDKADAKILAGLKESVKAALEVGNITEEDCNSLLELIDTKLGVQQ